MQHYPWMTGGLNSGSSRCHVFATTGFVLGELWALVGGGVDSSVLR